MANLRVPDTGGADYELWIRYFSGAVTPIVNYAGNSRNIWDHQIAINLGNLRDESAWRQNPIVIVTALVICSGLTSWLLEVVHTEWYVIIHKCTWTIVIKSTPKPEQSTYNVARHPKEVTSLNLGLRQDVD